MAMCRPRRIDSMVNGPWSPASGTGSVGAGGGGRLSGGAMAECGAGHRRRRAADGGRHSLRGDVLRGSVGDRSRVVVEAAFGLGEVVSGAVEPDTYVRPSGWRGPRRVLRTTASGHSAWAPAAARSAEPVCPPRSSTANHVINPSKTAVAATQAVGVSRGAPGTRRTAKAGQMAREVNAREAATV